VVPLTRSGSSPTDLWEAFTLVLAYSLLFAGWVIAMSGKRRRHDHMSAMSFWAHVAAALAIAFIFPYATLITGFASPWYEQSGATADAAGILALFSYWYSSETWGASGPGASGGISQPCR
jgi:uncharacterized membrane protein YozB (DUF420 family)